MPRSHRPTIPGAVEPSRSAHRRPPPPPATAFRRRPLSHHLNRHPRQGPPSAEAGTGLIGTLAGVTAFLFLLLFAVQVMVTLYATSTVEAAGYDAARSVAASSVDHDDPAAVGRATETAERRLRDLLGRRGDSAEVTWDLHDDAVRLRVTVDAPRIVPRSIRDTAGLRRIERTFVVRVEEGPT